MSNELENIRKWVREEVKLFILKLIKRYDKKFNSDEIKEEKIKKIIREERENLKTLIEFYIFCIFKEFEDERKEM